MIKILLADHHPVVCKGLAGIIDDVADIKISARVHTFAATLDRVRSGAAVDLILIDITLPDKNPLEIIDQIHRISSIPILVFTTLCHENLAVRVLRSGAAGYLHKTASGKEILEAIRKTAAGGKYITLEIAEKLAVNLANGHQEMLHQKLSNREYQVLCMYASGNTLSEIAQSLSLSIKTISTNRSRILKKMNLKNNAEMIRYAIQNELV